MDLFISLLCGGRCVLYKLVKWKMIAASNWNVSAPVHIAIYFVENNRVLCEQNTAMPQEADNMPGTLWMFHAEGLLCGVMRLGGLSRGFK